MTLVGAAADFIRKTFGGTYEEDDGTVSVGTTATRVVDSDPDRLALIIINLGANNVYLKPDNNPTSTASIQINASGGSVSMNVRDDLTLPTREWYGLAAANTSDCYFISVRRFAAG